jgi:hypothetical protein
LGNGEKSR